MGPSHPRVLLSLLADMGKAGCSLNRPDLAAFLGDPLGAGPGPWGCASKLGAVYLFPLVTQVAALIIMPLGLCSAPTARSTLLMFSFLQCPPTPMAECCVRAEAPSGFAHVLFSFRASQGRPTVGTQKAPVL